MSRKNGRKKIGIVSLGCPKNQVDSETLLGNLRNCEIVEDVEDADTIIINTCGFIEAAKRESIDTILEAVRLKNEAAGEGRKKEVIVTGCLSERYREELTKEIPEVDSFYGVNEYEKVASDISGHFQQNVLSDRVLLNDRHFAYLKISEGCNQKCSFCYIPMIRGRLKSKSLEAVCAEAAVLAGNGVKELVLVSQDTSSYGWDVYGKSTKNEHLIGLLTRLGDIDGLEWIRVMYLYPTLTSDDYLRFLASHPRVCNYVDMPIQHISDPLLKSMRRGISKTKTLDLIDRVRKFVPDVALRTSLIVGYPGETESAFEELVRFVEETRFDRLGVFTYSHEEGTSASGLKDDVPESVKKERYDRLMAVQSDLSLAANEARIGSTCHVLIDSSENDYYVGRTERDAPEIDNEVIVYSSQTLKPGTFVNVQITSGFEYDLAGNKV